MKIDTLVLPPLDNNCYIVSNNNDAIIIDPSSSENLIEKHLKDNNLNLVAIFVTHYHFDHVGALSYLKDKYNVKVYDFNTIGKFKIANMKIEVIPTKGHSNDSVSFFFKDTLDMFVGDFIFLESIGRTDLEGSDEEEMAYSLNMIKNYDKNIKLYPGHGEMTTLSHELIYNPYL